MLPSGDDLLAWQVPFVLTFVLSVVGFVLARTVVGLVLLPLLHSYVSVAVMYMIGRAFATASNQGTPENVGEDDGVPA